MIALARIRYRGGSARSSWRGSTMCWRRGGTVPPSSPCTTRRCPSASHSSTGCGCGTQTLAFAPDGRTLATGHLDGTVLLWKVPPAAEARKEIAASDREQAGRIGDRADDGDGLFLVPKPILPPGHAIGIARAGRKPVFVLVGVHAEGHRQLLHVGDFVRPEAVAPDGRRLEREGLRGPTRFARDVAGGNRAFFHAEDRLVLETEIEVERLHPHFVEVLPDLRRHVRGGLSLAERRKDGETSFIRCNVWRQQAENAAESLAKGTRAIVVGRLRQRGVICDSRGDVLRLGPAPYLTDDQLATAADTLSDPTLFAPAPR